MLQTGAVLHLSAIMIFKEKAYDNNSFKYTFLYVLDVD